MTTGVPFPAGAGIFLFSTASRLVAWHNQRVSETLSLGVQRPGYEADHSPPSSVEVKNAWTYTSIPQYVFMARCLVKHRDNFTFPFIFMILFLILVWFIDKRSVTMLRIRSLLYSYFIRHFCS